MKVKGGDVFTLSIEGPGRTHREKITDNKDGVLSSCPCRRKHSTEAGDLGGERLHNKAPPSLSPAPWGEAMEAMKAMDEAARQAEKKKKKKKKRGKKRSGHWFQ